MSSQFSELSKKTDKVVLVMFDGDKQALVCVDRDSVKTSAENLHVSNFVLGELYKELAKI